MIEQSQKRATSQISSPSQTAYNLLEQIRKRWYELWGETLTRRQAAMIIFNVGWPDDMRNFLVRLRFFLRAIDEAKNYADHEELKISPAGPWIHAGLFRGSRWLWHRTWTSFESGNEIYQDEPVAVSAKVALEGLLRKLIQ